MYLSTTYKAYVAQAAAKLMTEMVGKAIENGSIDLEKSFDDNVGTYSHLAVQATSAAYVLADHLNDYWDGRDGGQTVFFDVQDSPTSRIENELSIIAAQLNEIVDKD